MEPSAIAAPEVQTNLNVVWTLIAGILVFTMQAGFALVETGFTRAKNAANIMMKNLMDFAAGSLGFYIIGAALMFGATKLGGWLGWGGLGMPSLSTGEGVWDWTFLFFQTMFAATAATIVSGAVAERIEFKSYLIYSVIVSAIVYPISGHWMWGSLAGEASQGAVIATRPASEPFSAMVRSGLPIIAQAVTSAAIVPAHAARLVVNATRPMEPMPAV